MDGATVEAESGTLPVAMNRTTGVGRVELAFVRLPSTAQAPGPPVVFLCGGPGISGIRFARGARSVLFDELRAAGDVILLDQRGSGASTPLFKSPNAPTFAFEQPRSRDDALAFEMDRARRRAEELAAAGVDLTAFNTNESVEDIVALTRALEVERVSILAWSYGTHLAFALLRRHEGVVARIVLAGPEGPDQTYKLPSRIEQQLFGIAERARTEHGFDLRAAMQTTFDALDRAPVRVPWERTRHAIVSRFDVEHMTAEGIADVEFVERMPRWYSRMARGDFRDIASDAVLRSYFENTRRSVADRAMVRVCMDCASGASAGRRERIAAEESSATLGRTVDFPFPEVCASIGDPDFGDAFRAPVSSSVPALFVTGTLDARTPRENVVELWPGFPNASRLEVEDAGHADAMFERDARKEIVRFLSGGEIETNRVRSETPLRFKTESPRLIYDGSCSYCRRQVERLRARVGDAVSFEPYQTAKDTVDIPEPVLARAVHFIDADGHAYSGAEAVLRARAAGGSSALLWMYRRVPSVAPLANAIYAWIARNRSRF